MLILTAVGASSFWSNSVQASNASSYDESISTFSIYGKRITIDMQQCLCISNLVQATVAYLSYFEYVAQQNAHRALKICGLFDIRFFLMQAFRAIYYKKYRYAPPYFFPTGPGAHLCARYITRNCVAVKAQKSVDKAFHGAPFWGNLYGLYNAWKECNTRKKLYHAQEALSSFVNYWYYNTNYYKSDADSAHKLNHLVVRPLISLYLLLTNPKMLFPICIEQEENK